MRTVVGQVGLRVLGLEEQCIMVMIQVHAACDGVCDVHVCAVLVWCRHAKRQPAWPTLNGADWARGFAGVEWMNYFCSAVTKSTRIASCVISTYLHDLSMCYS